jgi:hypothetical protein
MLFPNYFRDLLESWQARKAPDRATAILSGHHRAGGTASIVCAASGGFFDGGVLFWRPLGSARGYEPGPSDVNSGDGKTPRRAFPAIGRRVSLTLPSHPKARPAFNVVPARISTDGG